MKIGIPKEMQAGERRVACTPDEVRKLLELGYSVVLEKEAGLAAGYPDQDYRDAGASIEEDTEKLWETADILCKVRSPGYHPQLDRDETDLLDESHTFIGFIWPAQSGGLMEKLKNRGCTALAMDAVPRISRAQKMDALSSMSNIAGYRAVVEASQHFGRFFTGQITAAGRIPPAKVMVIGAGVAGLSAIGTAVNLGAIVRAFDTRPEVKEQIESMNAEFLELDFKEDGSGSGGYAKVMSDEFIAAEMALFAEQAREVDIIITTALIPGKPAPKLITKEMVRSMKMGSVVVDLAAEQGGNCEYTRPGEVVTQQGVTVIGHTDLPSRMATQSSQLYAANIRHLLTDLTPERDGTLQVNLDDEVIRGTTVVHRGEIIWPPPRPEPVPPAKPVSPPPVAAPSAGKKSRALSTLIAMGLGALVLLGVGTVAPADFMNHFIVFVLACFVGWQVIWNVTPALHTPLMSVTNAISGIIVIGSLLQINATSSLGVALAFVAVVISSINIAGGFLVTQRMLNMFQK
ncbi:MAG: Re/Si-specific NAD(P)(+) transhydrogenase subunit alpha [Gammaproteobacteria bacterium]|nr:Re/Si-specific NAD(P)(+) transhydrogenase subunit alpha [Gammaproteobacteria bacterium]